MAPTVTGGKRRRNRTMKMRSSRKGGKKSGARKTRGRKSRKSRKSRKTTKSRKGSMPRLAKTLRDAIRKAGGAQPFP